MEGEHSASSAHFHSFGQHPLPPRSSKHTLPFQRSHFPHYLLTNNEERPQGSYSKQSGNQELHLSPDRVDITSSYAKPAHRWLITTFSLFTKPSSSFALSFFSKKLGFAPKNWECWCGTTTPGGSPPGELGACGCIA